MIWLLSKFSLQIVRRKVQTSRHSRCSSPVWQGFVLCLLTFAVLLPLSCHRLLYSYYFIKSWYLNSMSDEALEESYRRGQEALEFWQDQGSTLPAGFVNSDNQEKPELLVTVVTTLRSQGGEYHYLLQVMQQLVSLVAACQRPGCVQVLVCDVESSPQENEDARLLETKVQVVRRSLEELEDIRKYLNIFEKEKRDYVFCLRKGWNLIQPKNVVVLEDDALPTVDFFPVINDLLSRRFSSQTLYVKLYHPERLQRYWNPEPYRILEWVGLGLVGATALLLFFSACAALSFSFSTAHFLFLTLYVMAAVELLGRHYLLEARRLSPQLYAVSPATECCTPAMLFPGNASLRVAEYLDQVFCFRGNAKDTVLYHIVRSIGGERAHSLEPNLITHIGAFSSVRTNPSHPRLL
ncbi:post-GPI attachment to proteins factor 4 [Paramormyrops kingsleyae]|uniref:Post-GPI attachment to proteins GalNAc transferase 4 n=1 Tax=Paramormyrops kingsleyae TaxID=1676925 RepID=A0A3B3Q4J6_9TELE|nr:transmembrane protein 246 [Paramormyrops kingsleyae]XP_023686166.1 transmembrane protein 246 [Paramormyrops kingsleyae]XP_023686167.1 transmembrane protein 246 [Paramormyrops kingsleyae]